MAIKIHDGNKIKIYKTLGYFRTEDRPLEIAIMQEEDAHLILTIKDDFEDDLREYINDQEAPCLLAGLYTRTEQHEQLRSKYESLSEQYDDLDSRYKAQQHELERYIQQQLKNFITLKEEVNSMLVNLPSNDSTSKTLNKMSKRLLTSILALVEKHIINAKLDE